MPFSFLRQQKIYSKALWKSRRAQIKSHFGFCHMPFMAHIYTQLQLWSGRRHVLGCNFLLFPLPRLLLQIHLPVDLRTMFFYKLLDHLKTRRLLWGYLTIIQWLVIIQFHLFPDKSFVKKYVCSINVWTGGWTPQHVFGRLTTILSNRPRSWLSCKSVCGAINTTKGF